MFGLGVERERLLSIPETLRLKPHQNNAAFSKVVLLSANTEKGESYSQQILRRGGGGWGTVSGRARLGREHKSVM